MTSILFVCHGNICRSTMAEFVMKDLVHKQGLSAEFHIESAATHNDEIGNDTHYGTKRKLDEMGVPYTKRAARRIRKQDYETFDLIIGMDSENMYHLASVFSPDPQHKVHKLLEYCGIDRDVADPWYTGDFDATWNDVYSGCLALLHLYIKNKETRT